MGYYELLLARKLSGGGGGSSIDVEPLSVTTNGTYTAPEGTAYSPVSVNVSGGGSDEWKRPADWPDLSKLSRTGTVVYATYKADYPDAYYSIFMMTTSNSHKAKIAVGNIVNGEYVVESEIEANHNAYTRHLLGIDPSGYKVLRITEEQGYPINMLTFGDPTETQFTVDGVGVTGMHSSLLEVYGNLPNTVNTFSTRACHYVQSVDVKNVIFASHNNNLNYSFAYCYDLANLDATTWNTTDAKTFDSAFREVPCVVKGFENFKTSNSTNFGYTFDHTLIESADLRNWNMSNVTSISRMFNYAKKLKSVKLNGPGVACTASNLFDSCWDLEDVYISDTSKITTFNSTFSSCNSIIEFDLSDWDMSSATSTNSTFTNMRRLVKITLPPTLSVVGNSFLNGCFALMEIHFKATTPPSLSATSPFPTMNVGDGRKIYVPYSADHSILNAYKTATNWSSYADYIFEEEQ